MKISPVSFSAKAFSTNTLSQKDMSYFRQTAKDFDDKKDDNSFVLSAYSEVIAKHHDTHLKLQYFNREGDILASAHLKKGNIATSNFKNRNLSPTIKNLFDKVEEDLTTSTY